MGYKENQICVVLKVILHLSMLIESTALPHLTIWPYVALPGIQFMDYGPTYLTIIWLSFIIREVCHDLHRMTDVHDGRSIIVVSGEYSINTINNLMVS